MKNDFQLYGHRGTRGTLPESTLAGYAKALEIGVDVIDMDVVMTKDKILVVYHDLTLNPDTTRDNTGNWIAPNQRVRDKTLAELKNYDVGQIRPGTVYAAYFPHQGSVASARILTLAEVIDYAIGKRGQAIRFQIEIKTNPEQPEQSYSAKELAQAVADMLHRKNIVDRTEVQAFDWACLLALKNLDKKIITAFLTDPEMEKQMRNPDPKIAGLWTGGYLLKDYDSLLDMIKALGGNIWGPENVEVTQQNLRSAHAKGLRVVAWPNPKTLDHKTELAVTKKLIDLGIDGIITDWPEEVMALKKK